MAKLLDNPKIKLIALVLLIAGLSLGFARVYNSLQAKSKKLGDEIAKNNAELKKTAGIAAAQEALNAEIKELAEKTASQQEKLFSDVDVENIVTSLDRFAQECKIFFKNIDPLERTKKDIPHRDDIYLSNMPVSIKLKCDYFQLIMFLKKIENMQKYICIDSVNVQGDSSYIWAHNVLIYLEVPILVSGKK